MDIQPQKKLRYSKPYSARFRKPIEKKLLQFCLEHECIPSEVIQHSIECLITEKECIGKQRIIKALRGE